MKIIISINNKLDLLSTTIKQDEPVGKLVKEFAAQVASNDDVFEDVEIYLRNKNDDFDKGKTFTQLGIKPGDHLFVGRCKSITVNINYNGQCKTYEVPPSRAINRLRKRAIEDFNLSSKQSGNLVLRLEDQSVLQNDWLIGSATDYPNCIVDLYLTSKKDIQGSPDQELFDTHLESANYMVGSPHNWELINVEGQVWPYHFFRIPSLYGSGEYVFRFNLANYPSEAPTATFWDIENNVMLPFEKWPQFTPRQIQVFRSNWQSGACFYLPCDRVTMKLKPGWKSEHPDLWWNSQNDTIVKYLAELHQNLN